MSEVIERFNETVPYGSQETMNATTFEFLPTQALPNGPTLSVDGRAIINSANVVGTGTFQVLGDGAALNFNGAEVGSGITVNLLTDAQMAIDGNGFHALVASWGAGAVIEIPGVAAATGASLIGGVLTVHSGSLTDAAFHVGGGISSLLDLTFSHTAAGEFITAK